jgi:NAD(P)-dependent dehydrogenase (short-subunit alcohol dehydrogenase family)
MLGARTCPSKNRVNVICQGAALGLIIVGKTRLCDYIEDIPLEPDAIQDLIPLTDNTPGSSEQIAQLVLFLVSDASSFITGTEVWIDGAVL